MRFYLVNHFHHRTLFISLLSISGVSLLFGAACVPKPNPVTTAPADSTVDTPHETANSASNSAPTTAAPESPTSASPTSWNDMNSEQRTHHMKTVITPRMRDVFMEISAEKYAQADCTLCHGARAKSGDFSMPNPDLDPLSATEGFAEESKEHPETVKFMMERVVPEMAQAMGVEAYNPQTQKGFGCFNCHVAKSSS